MTEAKGAVVIVSGPSGAGKTTICRAVADRLENVYLSVSVTTREKSKTEIDGKDYWFVSRDEFQKRIDQKLLLEYEEIFGNLYGTPKDKTDQVIKAGKTVVLEIDVKGAKQVRAQYPEAVMIFILSPGREDLVERINQRAREDIETTQIRLGRAESEIAAARKYYQHIVVNDELEKAIEDVIDIIKNSTGEKRK